MDCTGKKFDKGGFTRSVRTDNGDSAVEVDIDVNAFEDDLFGCISECHLVQLQEWRRDLFRVGELERFVIFLLRRFQFRQFLKNLDPRLSLRGAVRIVPPSIDIRL